MTSSPHTHTRSKSTFTRIHSSSKWRSANNMLLLLDLHIAQHIIPNSTVATTQHVFPKHSFLQNFQKYNFSKFLGPFPGPLGLLPLIFEFPYSRCISSNFFRRFYPNFSSLFIPIYPRHSRIGLNQLHSTRSLVSVQSPRQQGTKSNTP